MEFGAHNIQVPPLSKGARGISGQNNKLRKTFPVQIDFFKSIKFILLLKYKAEIPLNPPFTKGEDMV